MALLVGGLLAAWAPPGTAQEGCPRAVVVTLPGVTWSLVDRVAPPNILELAEDGSLGSVSVRTNSARTSYASGYVTLGAGTRTDGGRASGGVADAGRPLLGTRYLAADVRPGGFEEIVAAVEEADYRSEPGALADAVKDGPVVVVGNGDPGLDPPLPLGFGRWALLAGAATNGVVDVAGVGSELLRVDADAPFGVITDPTRIADAVAEALALPCSVTIVDQGDLSRADRAARLEDRTAGAELDAALLATDRLVGRIAAELDQDRDLLLLVSPTSPWWDQDVHLGVAIARGPGFPAGSGLVSASTRQDDIVTLVDVAPTILGHLGEERPSSMLGRPWVSTDSSGDRIAAARALDRESVFAHSLQADLSTGFVIVQVLIYGLAVFFISRGGTGPRVGRIRAYRKLEVGALAIAAFPLVTYLQSPIPAHSLGAAGFVVLLLALDALVVVAVLRLFRQPLERLLAITASTIGVFILDLVAGTNLQLNAVWGNDPIVAGRFTGLGNIAFAVLGTTALLTGALLVHRWPNDRRVFVGVVALFVVTVIADGAPQLGSDVGGVLALVPSLGITLVLLAGRRPSARAIAVSLAAAVLALGAFLALDLLRPSAERTHLARLYETISDQGGEAFFDAVERKIDTNVRVFRSTIWTFLFPPALAVLAGLLLRPRGRWRRLAERYPRLRAGLIGGLLLGVLGFAVNDSGIVVPAMSFSYLVPLALLLHLTLERAASPASATEGSAFEGTDR